jgi:hypothetical protein
LIRTILKLLPIILLAVIGFEVFQLFRGPVFLMNEYQELYGQTKINNQYVANQEYLAKPERFPVINTDSFRDKNRLEYRHQDMTRGQIDHINYILNPANEYFSGKPADKIYFQYGFGNTLFLGYCMRALGGLSIDNYYKCYSIYFLYAFFYLIALGFIFRNFLYTAGAFSAHAAGFFWCGFIGFILAPGISPFVHLFDIAVVLLAFLYYKKEKIFLLPVILFLLFLAVVFNLKFGGALCFAFFVSLAFYIHDRPGLKAKPVWLASLGVLFIGLLACAFKIMPHHADPFFKYFLLGFFSNSPGKSVVFRTFFYFIVSYGFLYFLKPVRSPFKYLYVLVFFYNQFLLAYYFWSGLLSHFVFSVYFLALQIFIMLFILEQSRRLAHFVRWGAYFCTGLAVLLVVNSGYSFYCDKDMGKKLFSDNFEDHQVYQWDFKRAKLISTINPQPIADSLALIQKYSPVENSGAYIISKYDNLLPFLANRYSLMPHFALAGYLLNEKASHMAIDTIMINVPLYLYVDRDIETKPNDLWASMMSVGKYKGFLDHERAARFERYGLLKNIFEAVKDKYVKIDEKGLLAVYKRE